MSLHITLIIDAAVKIILRETAEESMLAIERLPKSFVEADKDPLYRVDQLRANHSTAL